MEQNYMMIGIKLLGALGLLIYGMKMMSEALQKMAGSQLRHILGRMTTNRLTGMLTGTFVTCAVQSSSATTVMTVSFVSAGLLTLGQAISVIMGANIGTTLTAWIMSLGYNVDLTAVVFPSFVVGMVLIYKKRHRYVGDFLFGIGFMFLSLVMLSNGGRELDLEHNPAVVEFFASFDTDSYLTILAFLGIGTLITGIVQSSAAVMAITIMLCSTGVLPIHLGVALVMGENIGTTATANLAALGANTQARRAALAHLLFNVFGVIWVLIVFFPFVRLVCGIVGLDPYAESQSPTQLSFALAAFHTGFNVINTAILIWFIPQIEKLVCAIIKPKITEDEEESRLQFIRGGIMKTPEISVLQAQKEINVFGERMQKMFDLVQTLTRDKEDDEFQKIFDHVAKLEDISDNMENEIGRYLGEVGQAHLSDDTKTKISGMLRQIGELESIGDSCFNLARILRRGRENKVTITDGQVAGVSSMFALVAKALELMNTSLTHRRDEFDIALSEDVEKQINATRNRLKQQNIQDVDNRVYSYDSGTVYMDIVSECEKTGDYIINVVEARMMVSHHQM